MNWLHCPTGFRKDCWRIVRERPRGFIHTEELLRDVLGHPSESVKVEALKELARRLPKDEMLRAETGPRLVSLFDDPSIYVADYRRSFAYLVFALHLVIVLIQVEGLEPEVRRKFPEICHHFCPIDREVAEKIINSGLLPYAI